MLQNHESTGSSSASLSHLPSALATAAEAGAGHESRGMDGPEPDPGALERARAAAADTVAQHLGAKANGKNRGKTGSSTVSMGPLGDGSDPAPGEEGEPVPGALDLEDGGEAGFESDLFQAGAELTTDCANDLVSTVMEVFATVQLRDPAKAAICAERVRMKAAREARIRATIARWAEKNPQKAAKFFGALLLWDPAMWLGDVTKQFSAVAAAGSKLRENTAPALTTSGAPAATATPIAAVIPTPAMIPKPLKAEDFTA